MMSMLKWSVLTEAARRAAGRWRNRGCRRDAVLANAAGGIHEGGRLTKKADGAIAVRYLLGKTGTDAEHVAVCGAGDRPLGVITDEAEAAEDLVNVETFGAAGETKRMVASEALAAGSLVYTAADGKVRGRPSATGTCYCVGRALTAASADGDLIEADPMAPQAYPAPASILERTAEAALTLAHTVVKQGAAAGEANVCGAADRPLGVVAGTAAQDEAVDVQVLNGQPVSMVAGEAVAIGEGCYTAASGKVQNKPSGAGTYYCVGTALEAASADGDVITVLGQPPSVYVI